MTPGRTWRRVLALAMTLTVAAVGLSRPACAQTPAYDLLIQRSPVEAGEVTPETGAHRVSANSSVALTASPQPGYRFAYWLGDVSDPTAERTTILVNEPKLVIAVFHPDTAKRVEDQLPRNGGGGGSDIMSITATDLYAPGMAPPAGPRKRDTHATPIIIPVFVPEPATIILLSLGTMALRRRR